MEEHNYPEEEIDLRGLFEVLWRRKWLILAIIVLSVAFAGFFSFFVIPPVYEAGVLIELRPPKQVEDREVYRLQQAEKKEAYRLQIEDPYFLSQIIERLQLDPQKYDPFSLQEALRVEIPGNTNFFKIIVKDSDPQKAAEIANDIASEFVDFVIRSTQDDVKKELLSLEEGIKEWQIKLDEVGKKRKDFLVQSEIATLEKEEEAKRDLLGIFQRDLLQLDVQEKELQATLGKSKEELESEPHYFELQKSVRGNLEDENKAGGLVSDLFPVMIENEVINEVYNTLKWQVMNLEAQLSGMEARKKTIREAAREVQVELKELEGLVLEKAIKRDQLQREYDSILEAYSTLIQEYEKTQVYSKSEEVNAGVKIVSPALPPEEPISPRKMLNLAIAGVLGIFVGIIAAFVTEYWKKTTPST